MDLTTKDIDILAEALQAWEAKDFGGELMGALFGGMLMKSAPPEEKAKYEAEEQARREKAEEERKARKRESIILQGKLFQLRERIQEESLKAMLSGV